MDERDQRFAEIAEILALGLTRLRQPKSSQISALPAENSLDISQSESGHGRPSTERGRHD